MIAGVETVITLLFLSLTSFLLYYPSHLKTGIVTEVFFMMMARHPEVAAKAQEEIDRVIGKERLPTLADRASLPYMEYLIKEIYRFVRNTNSFSHADCRSFSKQI